MAANPRKVVVFSGGSAANSLVDVFNEVVEKNNCALTYIIPISDNGGSTSELIRVFGGPGIGDVRSMQVFSSGLAACPLSGTGRCQRGATIPNSAKIMQSEGADMYGYLYLY